MYLMDYSLSLFIVVLYYTHTHTLHSSLITPTHHSHTSLSHITLTHHSHTYVLLLFEITGNDIANKPYEVATCASINSNYDTTAENLQIQRK